MAEVAPPTEADIVAIAADMRPADRAEVWAASRLGPEPALRRSLDASTHAWAIRVDGQPLVLMGVGPISLLGGIGVPWLLSAGPAVRHAKVLHRAGLPILAAMRAAYPALLVNFVDARNATSIRWLRWLGFVFEPAAPHGAFGLPFHRFTMRMSSNV